MCLRLSHRPPDPPRWRWRACERQQSGQLLGPDGSAVLYCSESGKAGSYLSWQRLLAPSTHPQAAHCLHMHRRAHAVSRAPWQLRQQLCNHATHTAPPPLRALVSRVVRPGIDPPLGRQRREARSVRPYRQRRRSLCTFTHC